MSEDIRAPRRFTDTPDPEGWSAADVADSERVGDEWIDAEIDNPDSPVRRFGPLLPEDERIF